MLTNAQENIKNSLYNAINKWHSDNAEMIGRAFDSYWGDFVNELMTESAFNIMLAQLDVHNYHKENETNFAE